VGAIYLTIPNLIAVQKAELEGLVYLCVYNFGVILPILIIGTTILIGVSPTKVDRFRKEKRAMIRLVTGIILVVLGSVPDVWYDLSGRQPPDHLVEKAIGMVMYQWIHIGIHDFCRCTDKYPFASQITISYRTVCR